MPQQARALVPAEHGSEDRGRVVVVHPAFVALVVRLLRGPADQGGEVGFLGEGLGAVFVEEAGGEVFGAVDLG